MSGQTYSQTVTRVESLSEYWVATLRKKRRVEVLEKHLADERARAAQVPQLTGKVEELKTSLSMMKKDARFRQGRYDYPSVFAVERGS